MARKKSLNKVSKYRVWNVIVGIATLTCLVAIIWIDVTSGFWQEMVILSGVAAGLVTFLFTALFLDDAVARREHRKWFPVTRLALTDLLHTIADEDRSDLSRGQIVARTLPTELLNPTPDASSARLDELLEAVVLERNEITEVLARWAQFLAASADVADLMVHLADLAEHLDGIRDQVVEIESHPPASTAELRRHIESYNTSTRQAIDEILRIQDSLNEE